MYFYIVSYTLGIIILGILAYPVSSGNCMAPGNLDQEYLFMTDMMGKSTFDLGNYDYCQSNPLAQYCLMISSSVQFGICIPSDCNMPEDALNSTTQLLNLLLDQIEFLVLLAPEDAIYYCGDNSIPWSSVSSAPLIIMCTIIASFVSVIIIATVVDCATYNPTCRFATLRNVCCRSNMVNDLTDNSNDEYTNLYDDDHMSNYSSSIGGGTSSILGKKRKFITNLKGNNNLPLSYDTATNNSNSSNDNNLILYDPKNSSTNDTNGIPSITNVSGVGYSKNRKPDVLYYSDNDDDDNIYSSSITNNYQRRTTKDQLRNSTVPNVVSPYQLASSSPFNYLNNNAAIPSNGSSIGTPSASSSSSSSTPSFITGTTIPRTRSAWQQRNNITVDEPKVLLSSSIPISTDNVSITNNITTPLSNGTTVELPPNSLVTNTNVNGSNVVPTIPNLTVTIPSTGTTVVEPNRQSSNSTSSNNTPMNKGNNIFGSNNIIHNNKPRRTYSSSAGGSKYLARKTSPTYYNFFRKFFMFFSLRKNWYTLWDIPMPILPDRIKKDSVPSNNRTGAPNAARLRSPRPSQAVTGGTISNLKPLTPSFRSTTTTNSIDEPITYQESSLSSPNHTSQRTNRNSAMDSNASPSHTQTLPHSSDDSANRKSQRRTSVIDGIRALSILYIILGNTLYFMLTPGFTNWIAVAPPNGIISTWLFQIFPSATFASDTFLLLSGFCATTSLLSLAEISAGGGIEGPNERNNEALPALRGNHATLGAYSVNRSFGLTIHSTFVYIFRRFIRIWPLYAFIVGFYTSIFPLLGSGPFWWSLQSYTSACTNYWWSNLVFLNNVFPGTNSIENSCMPWTWYIAVDTQLYLIVPILLFLYLRQPSLGITAITVLIVASIVAAEEIVSVGNISAIFDFYIQLGQTGPSQEEINYNDQYGVRMWTRAPPFLLGILLTLTLDRVGTARQRYFAAARQWELAAATGNTLGIQTYVGMHSGLTNSVMLPPNLLNMSIPHSYTKRTQYILLSCGILLIGLCMFSSVTAYNQVPNPWSMEDQVSYTILTRPAWSIGIALILFTSLSQDSQGGWIGSILRLSIWRPIAKLSYALFLVHPLWLQLIYYTRTQYFRYSALMIIQWIASNIFISCILAIILYLMIELPCIQFFEWYGHRLYNYLPSVRSNLYQCLRSWTSSSTSTKNGKYSGHEQGNEYLLDLHDDKYSSSFPPHHRTSSSSDTGSKRSINICNRFIMYLMDCFCGNGTSEHVYHRTSRNDTYTTPPEQPMGNLNNRSDIPVNNNWNLSSQNQPYNRDTSRSDSFGSSITFGSVMFPNTASAIIQKQQSGYSING